MIIVNGFRMKHNQEAGVYLFQWTGHVKAIMSSKTLGRLVIG